MNVECIKDVVMNNGKYEGKSAFTAGTTYRSYKYLMKDGYESRFVTAAKNNFSERHIIKDKNKTDEFYDNHFQPFSQGSK